LRKGALSNSFILAKTARDCIQDSALTDIVLLRQDLG